MSLEITGTIVNILPIQSGTSGAGKEWRTQDYVLRTGGQYSDDICFNAFGDKIETFAIKVGETLNVHINIKSREYQGRYFTNVQAWKVDRPQAANTPPPPVASMQNPPATDGNDGLPF